MSIEALNIQYISGRLIVGKQRLLTGCWVCSLVSEDWGHPTFVLRVTFGPHMRDKLLCQWRLQQKLRGMHETGMLQKGEKMKKAIAANEKSVTPPIVPIKGPRTGSKAASTQQLVLLWKWGKVQKKEAVAITQQGTFVWQNMHSVLNIFPLWWSAWRCRNISCTIVR